VGLLSFRNVRQPYSARGLPVNAGFCANALAGVCFAHIAVPGGCVDTRGRVVDVSADGRIVNVHWSLRPGHEHQTTTEDEALLRRVHESEEGMVTP
jgi:hypothetical protein